MRLITAVIYLLLLCAAMGCEELLPEPPPAAPPACNCTCHCR